MEKCPCGSDLEYSQCCEPLILGNKIAQSPEALLRSRYTAHVKIIIDYIVNTVHPEKKEPADEKGIRKWAEKTQWQNLEILKTEKGKKEDSEGTVEFKAHYREKGIRKIHHELAIFKKVEEKWYFFDAQPGIQEQSVRREQKIGRNDPCACGSGKKFKKCCGK